MLTIKLLAALAGSCLAAPAARFQGGHLAIHLTNADTGDCDALIEDKPWNITNLVTFKANSHPHAVSYLTFNFEDVNEGLETKTQCQHYLPAGSNDTVVDAEDVYHYCVDDDVRFTFDGKVMLVERYYKDPCLGKPPYDSAIAHGRAKLNFTMTRASDGILRTQAEVAMPISSLS